MSLAGNPRSKSLRLPGTNVQLRLNAIRNCLEGRAAAILIRGLTFDANG